MSERPKSHEANTRRNRREFRAGKLVLAARPSSVALGLTIKCNLDCVMCFSRHMPQHDMAPEVIAKLEPLFPDAETICWNDAGEILASSRTPEFIELMKSHFPKTSYVSSNFQLAHRWMDDIFASGLTEISVSIDAVDPFTGGKDSIFGIEPSLMKLVSHLKAAACGFGSEKRILLLHGPVGSAKSTVARLLKRGLRGATFRNVSSRDQPDRPVAVDQRECGDLYFEVLAVNTLDDKIDCSPAFVGDEMYLKGKQNLYCISASK